MATYNFSTFSTGTVFTSADILNFEDITDASTVRLSVSGADLIVTVAGTAKTLKGFSLTAITSTNFVFSNGTKMIIGDGATATTADDTANTLVGGDYNDYLDGRASGTGTDAFSADTVSYAAAAMAVTVDLSVNTGLTTSLSGLTGTGNVGTLALPVSQNTIGAGLDTIVRIENVTGSAFNDALYGTNFVSGVASGNNTIDGGLGIDTMTGGTGADSYFITPGDIVTELAATETAPNTTAKNSDTLVGGATGTGVPTTSGVVGYLGDTVYASFNYTLPTNVENLVLTVGDINGIGNSSNNFILGTSGKNLLDGGNGTDTLKGGTGDDIYIINSGSETILENAAAGTDTVWTAANWSTATNYLMPANVENLRMLGTVAVQVIGNDLDNIIYANTGISTTLSGAAGTDTVSFQYGANAGVTLTLGLSGAAATAGGGSGADVISNMENIIGSNYGDIFDSSVDTRANTLTGGYGNDTYTIDGADTVVELLGQGTDTIKATVSYDISSTSLAGVENLTLTATAAGTFALNGTGNALNNVILGNGANNQLIGNAGNDTLDGGSATVPGGAAASDTLQGNAGDDIYLVNSSSMIVTEAAGAGTDTVYASVTYSLLTNNSVGVENLILTAGGGAVATAATSPTAGSGIDGTGNDIANTITGNGGANQLIGGLGNDNLIGNNGADFLDGTATNKNNAVVHTTAVGNDTMTGGSGDDTYFVDTTGDRVIEPTGTNANTADEVISSIAYTLGTNVDDLTLAGSANINGTGNELDNIIKGNAGANSLTGAVGNDTLSGGAGIDTLSGGTGTDSLSGGTANDTYVIDIATDVIVEAVGEGIDFVQAASSSSSLITYVMSGNVENLTLTGTAASNVTGNDVSDNTGTILSGNTILGNAASNTILGKGGNDSIKGDAGADIINGGAGQDNLTGGAGADRFVFEGLATTATDGTPAVTTTTITVESPFGTPDIITDFVPGTDVIDLSSIVHLVTPGAPTVSFIGNIGGTTTTNALTNNTTAGITVSYFDNGAGGTTVFVNSSTTTETISTAAAKTGDFAITLTGSLTLSEANFIL